MSKFLSQLGVQSWQQRSDFSLPELRADSQVNVTVVQDLEEFKSPNPEPTSESPVVIEVVDNELIESSNHFSESIANHAQSLVCIGAGLQAIWQNDASEAWQLWQNIEQVFAFPADSVLVIDVDDLYDEQSVASAISEIRAAGVSHVVVFDCDHDLVDCLFDFVEVVLVPTLDEMLDEPRAKKDFYQNMVEVWGQ